MPSKLAGIALTLAAGIGGAVAPAAATQPANLDVSYARARALAPDAATMAARRQREQAAGAATLHGLPSEFDRVLGVPTFLWTPAAAAPVGLPLARKALIEAWARGHLAQRASALGLTPALIAEAELTDVHDLGRGALVARFQQRHAGLPVFNRRLNVVMRPDGAPLAISGHFAVDERPPEPIRFPVPAEQATALAFAQLGGAVDASALVVDQIRGEYTTYSAPVGGAGVEMTARPRVKRVLFPHPPVLEPAFYIELVARAADGATLAYAFVVSALDGTTLFRNNLTSHAAYAYRVFADQGGEPLDSPLGNGYAPFPGSGPDDAIPRVGVPSRLVTLEHGPGIDQPWLPDGATVTTGNHLDAYMNAGTGVPTVPGVTSRADYSYVEGSGDSRAATTSAGTFDFEVSADADPATPAARNAANVNLFYVANWLHDFWYAHGFDEAAGNAQESNYGRGGLEGDPLIVQGQSAGMRNNAGGSQFADGQSPVLQFGLFGTLVGEVALVAPAGAPSLRFAAAPYGPTTYDVSAGVVVAADGAGDSATDGCVGASDSLAAPPQPSLRDRIALIDEGGCSSLAKTRFAQSSGAVAAVLVSPGYPNTPLPATADSTTIPTVVIGEADGEHLKQLLAAGTTVTLRVRRDHSREVDRDASLDNQLVSHEYFHYVSSRLAGDTTYLTNSQGLALGEGWSDFAALLAGRRVPLGDGAFAFASYVTGDFYFGLRRYPYSTSLAKNPLTLRHITDGEPLPAGPPRLHSYAGNAEAHNAGEVWASLLWECYAGIVERDAADAPSRMGDYLLAGLKAVPDSPTFLEARDTVLAAALAQEPEDAAACAAGFARRGAGAGAVAPSRDSDDFAGVVESYDPAGTAGKAVPGTAGGAPAGGLLSLLLLAALHRRRSATLIRQRRQAVAGFIVVDPRRELS